MSIPLTINGAVFEYPVDFDENWGVDATGWAQAVTNGMLQMAGGSFPITADINFGPNFGLLSKYFETRSTLPATTGTVRLSSADAGIAWRNNANSANLILTTNASDNLLFNGSTISGGVNNGTQYQLGYYATTGNAISGLTLITASRALASDANGLPIASTTTATELGYVNGVTSAIQTQINTKANDSAVVHNTGTENIAGIKTFTTQLIGKGTTTNDNAAAGYIGEYFSSYNATPTNTPATGVWGDNAFITLTAGDWDISAQWEFVTNGATAQQFLYGIGTVTGNNSTGIAFGDNAGVVQPAVQDTCGCIAAWRVSIAGTTTYYQKLNATFTVGQPQVYGRISARRVR